ncbi:MAG: septum formation protein Maf [Clostridia bacterium]|nr:septum formation protein Maf [Clostridia bacterium]
MELVLASASPRRRDILDAAKISYTVCPSQVDESYPSDMEAIRVPELLARCKAEDVAATHPDAVVVGADTVVLSDGALLGKPKDRADACRMLRALSGHTHQVVSGIAVVANGVCYSDTVVTEVTMRPIADGEIEAYVNRDLPLDKAGAYGIQEAAGLFVSQIHGDYYNVVGLPLCRLGQLLTEAGFPLF